jgi:flagellar basal body-associated protein FliL
MYYSIRNKNLQKKNKKRTLLYIVLFICIIILFSFLGINILVNIINIVTDIKKSDLPQDSIDTIPPKSPYIYPYNEYTANKTIEIKGEAEASSSVILYLNDHKIDSVVGNTGSFVFKIDLDEGLNEFFLISKDSSGNTSANTKKYHVNYDKNPPVLEISNPQNNTVYSGIKNRIIEIKGVSEKNSIVTINDKFVYISDTGNFVYKFELSNGENKITIRSKDMAGNEEVKELVISYQE